MKDYATNEIIYNMRNKECGKDNLYAFLNVKRYFFKWFFYLDIDAATLASVAQLCSDNVLGDSVFANIEAYSRILASKFAHPRRVRMPRTRERRQMRKTREREREKETDRGRDDIKDTAKRRKGGWSYVWERERKSRMTMTSNEAPGSWNGAEKGGRDAARRDADAPCIFG